ncbi:uncharacterized protein LOC133286980 [Gastrolobium bilobum]|uniref:uncharacterized protein LOC133286980 n=1 Tax=Gastrolobium bilobum TaxID=150636 RepID=UPI002AAF96F7|nr:uncharacterized protein LOC133286980 [Gastrolobium bilobum]
MSEEDQQLHQRELSAYESEEDQELQQQHTPLAPPGWKKRKRLSKQLSMRERAGDIAWERRRRQIYRQDRRRNSIHNCDDLTDEDLHELKGCIELGFGFNEEDGQKLCNTLPALDLYFAVNRQLSPSPVSTPNYNNCASSYFGTSLINADSDPSWKICSPGDDPEHIKTKLRHWAQAVACSVMQSH